MQYLLSVNQEKELPSRLEYLYDTFHLFFIPYWKNDGFIHLLPLGHYDESVLFLVGHNKDVSRYLFYNGSAIDEHIVVLITCLDDSVYNVLPKNKALYASNPYCAKRTPLYSGKVFSFEFDISKSELFFYHTKDSNIIRRISKSFYRIRVPAFL